MLGGLCTAEYIQHRTGNYIRGSGLIEESLHQTCVFGVKFVDSVLEGMQYVQSHKGLLILANAVEKLKRSAFTQTIQSDGITAFESSMRGL